MSLPAGFGCFLFVLLHLWVLIITCLNRKKLQVMAGMMTAMTVGTSFGLGVGTVSGVYLPDRPLTATVIGVCSGAAAGLAAGMFIGLLAVLEGLMAGLMAGMMGAMLGVMVTGEDVVLTVKLLSVGVSGILFILYLMLQKELKLSDSFKKPAVYFLAVLLFLLSVYLWQGPLDQTDPDNHHHAGLSISSTAR